MLKNINWKVRLKKRPVLAGHCIGCHFGRVLHPRPLRCGDECNRKPDHRGRAATPADPGIDWNHQRPDHKGRAG